MNKFNCTKCGCCCRDVNFIEDFPYKALEDGTCEKLVDNLCTVYDNRPEVCKVDFINKKTGITNKEMLAFCKHLQEFYNYKNEEKTND